MNDEIAYGLFFLVAIVLCIVMAVSDVRRMDKEWMDENDAY